jgi:tetratricopeptide (TPR) repeat protein
VECDGKDPDIWFNLGEFYFQRGHRDAERCLWQSVELNRDDLEAWDLLRRWYQGHPNPQRLHAVLRVLALARPQDVLLQHELALAAEAHRDFALAQQTYRRLVERDPADPAAHLGLVRVYLKQGQVQEAYRHLGQVQESLPEPTAEVLDQWVHLGHRLRHHGRRDEAETCFRRALEHRPHEPELAQYLGEIALEREQWLEAFQWFERAGEVSRNDRHVWIPLMRRFFAEQDYAHAAACLDHLEELAQYLPGLWIEFDEVYGQAGRSEELRGRLARWLELGLVAGEHWEQLARLYERAGDEPHAAACRARVPSGVAADGLPADGAPRDAVFLEVQRPGPELPGEPAEPVAPASAAPAGARAPELPVEPDAAPEEPPPVAQAASPRLEPPARDGDAEYWIGQSETHLREGRLKDAMASLHRAVSLDLPRFRAWFRIGGLFYALGQLDEAEAAFARATALNGAEAKGWYNLGLCQAERGRLVPAGKSFQHALKCDRRFAKAWDWLGLLHFHAGEHPQARRCFVRCLAVGRDSANAWHNLGMLYRAMGQEEQSARCLAEAQRLGGVRERAGLGLPASGGTAAG